MKAEEFTRRREMLEGWEIELTTYLIDGTYHCHIDNVSPGATVSRGEGKSREAAEAAAIEKARERLASTRRIAR